MPRRRNNRRRTAGRGRRGGSNREGRFCEIITFSVQIGLSTTVTISKCNSWPANRSVRPVRVRVQVSPGYVPIVANGDSVSGPVPTAVQVRFYGPSGNINAESMPVAIGNANPRNVSLRYPRTEDWFPYSADKNTKLLILSAICLGAIGGDRDGFVRGIVFLECEFSHEVLSTSCPTYTHIEESIARPFPTSPEWERVWGTGLIPGCSTDESLNRVLQEVSLADP